MKRSVRNIALLVGLLGVALLVALAAFIRPAGKAGTPGVSGDWVVDSDYMMAFYMQSGLGRWDAAMKVASYSDMRVTIAGNTIRMRDGDGFHDCTATFRKLPFNSEDELLDALVDYHRDSRTRRSKTALREETRKLIHAGELNLVIAEITANENDGKGMDIFKVGQKCILYAPGPKDKEDHDIAFTFKWFGGDIAPLTLARADSSRGKELTRRMEETEERARDASESGMTDVEERDRKELLRKMADMAEQERDAAKKELLDEMEDMAGRARDASERDNPLDKDPEPEPESTPEVKDLGNF